MDKCESEILYRSKGVTKDGNPFLTVKRARDNYIYSERGGVNSIAFILYDNKSKKIALIHEEKPPRDEIEKKKVNMTTAFGGSIDTIHSYKEICQIEVREESGYIVPLDKIHSIGLTLVSSQMSQLVEGFLVDVTDIEKTMLAEHESNSHETVIWLSYNDMMKNNDWKSIWIYSQSIFGNKIQKADDNSGNKIQKADDNSGNKIQKADYNSGNKIQRIIDFSKFKKMENRVMLADSYKYSHASQYPLMSSMFDYMSSRGGVYPSTIFVGAQPISKEFSNPIEQWEVDEAYENAQAHGVPFDIKGWDYIVQNLGGKIPVRIKSIEEGKLIPVNNVLMTFESTDSNVPWVAGWMETVYMKVWYPTTVATKSYYIKQMLLKYGSLEWAIFAYHNFGDRSSSSIQSAAIGGFAHSTQFKGTDNFNSLRFCKNNYSMKNVDSYSVFATEHSTTTANADGSTTKEIAFIEKMLRENPDAPILSFVADSYDIYKFTKNVTNPSSIIRKTIESRSHQKFVIRPDSGKATVVIKKMINIMNENGIFNTEILGQDGVTRKASKDFGILWGDGITPETIEEILKMVIEMGYAAENMVFGSGGDIMQNVNRDTQKFAIKCSSITRLDGTEQDVFKNPITDPSKASKKGRITTFFDRDTKTYFVDRIKNKIENNDIVDALVTVFENGIMTREFTMDEIRHNT
jgi:nicotinamide phosphoribosyltransferase